MTKGKEIQPILITGPPRSRTSMVAGVIHHAGAFGGVMLGPHPESPHGFFENRRIKQDVFEPYLFSMDYDLLGLRGIRDLPALRDNRRIRNLKKRIEKILYAEGYDGRVPWFYKNPMICLVASAWQNAFPKAKWIFVRRDIADNAKSCMRTSWMRGFDTAEQWMEYLQEYNDRMDDLIAEGVDYIEISSYKPVNGDYSELKTMVADLNLSWDEEPEEGADKERGRIMELIIKNESWQTG